MKFATASTRIFLAGVLLLGILGLSGCAMTPGGVAASTTPIDGRKYVNLGPAVQTDSRIYLLGFIPVSGGNYTRDAIDKAVESKRGDAMIDVTVESFWQWWILWTRVATRVEGNVIRFER
jgi:hypothetical protein